MACLVWCRRRFFRVRPTEIFRKNLLNTFRLSGKIIEHTTRVCFQELNTCFSGVGLLFVFQQCYLPAGS